MKYVSGLIYPLSPREPAYFLDKMMNIFCLVIVLITSSLSRHYLIEIGSNIETGGTEENGSAKDILYKHDTLDEGTASGNDYQILYGTKLCEPGKPCPHCKDAYGNYVMPGQSYSDGCNTCFCTEAGHGGCTKMMCLDFRPIHQLDKTNQTL